MLLGSKATHIRANLGDDTGGGRLPDADHPLHQRHGFLKRVQGRFQLGLPLAERLLQELDMSQDAAEQDEVMGLHPPIQGFA
jgi:hypothetical protein